MEELLNALANDAAESREAARERVKMRLIERLPNNPTRNEAVEALLNEVEQTLLPAMATIMADLVNAVGNVTVVQAVATDDENAMHMMCLAAFLIDTRLNGEVVFSTDEFNAWVESHNDSPFHVHDYGPDETAVLRVHSMSDDSRAAPVH